MGSTAKLNQEKIQLSEIILNKKERILIAEVITSSKGQLASILPKFYNVFAANPESRKTLSAKNSINLSDAELKRYRLAIKGEDPIEILNNLLKEQYLSFRVLGNQKQTPKIAFLFTGQGSQYFGMAKTLYENNSIFRKSLDDCFEALEGSLPLKEVIWGETETSLLDQSIYSQTAIFCIEFGLIQIWNSLGVRPDLVLGPSAGGFAAAVCAGVLNWRDGLKLISERARLIQNLPSGGMTSVLCTVPKVQEIISSCFGENGMVDGRAEVNGAIWLDIAVINSKDDIVMAGRPETLQIFEEKCLIEGIKYKRLAASNAFHSREIEGIREKYAQILNQITFNKPKYGFVAGVSGKVLREKSDFGPEYWQSHARDPVDLPAAMERLYDEGCRIFIEIGPRPVLVNDGRHILGPEKSKNALWLNSLKKDENDLSLFLQNVGHLFAHGIDMRSSFE